MQILNEHCNNLCQQVSRTRPRAALLNITKLGVSARSNLQCSICNLHVLPYILLHSCVIFPGQTAGPGSQQTSSPDFNAWVDFYRQPMAYFNQGTPQTQAPGLQVRAAVVAFLMFSSHSCSQCLTPLLLFCTPNRTIRRPPRWKTWIREDENNPFYNRGGFRFATPCETFRLSEKH